MKMKISILTAVIAATVFTLAGCGGGPAGQLGLKADSYGEAELDNGSRILVHPATNTESPLVAYAIRMDAGVDAEEDGEAGYSSLLARLLARTGEGAASTILSQMGSALTVEVQSDSLLLAMTVLREDAEAAYAAVASAIKAEYSGEELTAERDRLVAELEASADPARDLLGSTLYSGTARAVKSSDRIASLNAMTAESFSEFAARALDAGGMTVAVVGAVDNALLDAVVEETGTWAAVVRAEDADGEETDEVEDEEGDYTPILVLDRPSNATGLFMLRRLPGLDPQTYYELEALNLILNGQSTYGRLTGVQVALRLPRSIDSSLDLRANDSSQVISTTVQTDRAAEAFGATMQELDRLHSGTVLNSRLTEQEIADARNFLTGRLIRQTETSAQLARFLVWSAAVDFPGNLPSDHLAIIEGLTKAQLLEAVEQYFYPRLNALIAVGPASALEGQFSDFGPVRVVQ